jgi:hypothetical protein
MKKIILLVIFAAVSTLLKAQQTITIPLISGQQPNTFANYNYYNFKADSTLLKYAPIPAKVIPRSLFNGAANNSVTYSKRLVAPLEVIDPVSKMPIASVSSDDKMPVANLFSGDKMPIARLGGGTGTYVVFKKRSNPSNNPDSVKFEKVTP